MRLLFYLCLLLIYLVLVLSMLLPPSSFGQGSLTPPGPPAPTFKTLDQTEPRVPVATNTTPGDGSNLFIINQPGSYYLTTNLVAVAGKNGITISADDVTLDLHGFALIGVAGSFEGVRLLGLRTNIALRNGTVRGWGSSGVAANSASSGHYQDLRLSGNGQWGLNCGFNCVVVNCTAQRNGNNGIQASTGSEIRGCTASVNTGAGIIASDGCTVRSCTATYNTGDGIKSSVSSIVKDCAVRSNGGAGINASDASTVNGCAAYYNTGIGIGVGTGSTVSGCTAQGSGGDGIVAGGGSTVSGCTVTGGTGDGIEVSSSCRVADNNCTSNGVAAAAIHVTGSDNRIDGNNCVGQAVGLKIESAGNLIVRNTARNNTTSNYDMVGGNANGEILNVSVGNTITNVSAWANFSY
jgi:parallel beta-helix repeat protein